MTWHLGGGHARLGALLGLLTTLVATGCGSSGSSSAKIEILAPEEAAELTIADDEDNDMPGVQYDVKAKSEHVAEGTIMLLRIEGESEPLVGSVDEQGEILFDDATLPPGAHTMHVASASGSPTSDDRSYTLKTLVIDSPRDGAGIAFGDDLDQDKDGVQINVTVKAYAIDATDDISLSVDGAVVGDPEMQDEEGEVIFRGVTLDSGSHKLKAMAGEVESSENTVSVNEACATISFVEPAPPEEGERLTVGGGDDCPGASEDFVIDVTISTDAGDGRDVQLTVNGLPGPTTKVDGALARFTGVVLNRLNSANELSVTVQGAGDVTCAPEPFPAEIYVDCEGADCTLAGPVPYSGKDASNKPTLYLNKSMQSGSGFDIRVESDPSVLGEKIQLIVDGRDGKNALNADPGAVGNKVAAVFEDVRLAEGEHVIEARCTDNQGNVRESGEAKWFVDTEDCPLAIERPADDTLFIPGDDADTDADGIQIEMTYSIEGDDCVGQRAATCDPEDGIEGDAFDAFDGSPVTRDVTLENVDEQQLCAESTDRARNISRDSVTVRNRAILPNVEIESPADGTRFNALGGGDYTADSDANTPACNADFVILCSDVGADVELRRGSSTGDVVATGTCEAASDAPEGYAGRATLPDVAFFAGNSAEEAELVATQTVTAGSNQSLVGYSQTVTLTGLCQVPRLEFIPACPAAQLELPMSGDLVLDMLRATYVGTHTPPEQVRLQVRAGSSSLFDDMSPVGGANTYDFDDVNLGSTVQEVSFTLSATDAFDNVAADRTCTSMLVTDLPTLMISQPADAAMLGVGDSCTPTDPTRYGVEFQLTADQTMDRELSYTVNGGAATPVPLSGTSVTVCVPVDEGANTVSFALDSTLTSGVANVARNLTVRSVDITSPTEGSTLTAANCGPGGMVFAYNVTAAVAPLHAGRNVLFTSGAQSVSGPVTGGAVTVCIPLAQGANTIQAQVMGTNATDSVMTSVLSASPGNAITGMTIGLPAAGSYRGGEVAISWTAPTQEFPGQLNAYQLKCWNQAILASADTNTKESWWMQADTIPLPGSVVPPMTSTTATFRIGEERHCVIRGYNTTAVPMGMQPTAAQLTPIPDSVPANYVFREHDVDVAGVSRMGSTLARVGDINGDGIDDILVGGSAAMNDVSRAWLYFGANPLSSGAPSVTFENDVPVFAPGDAFGARTAGIGDFNGDGRNDFAISYPEYSTGSTFNLGMVYVFYGRASGDAWPTTVNLSAEAGCAADLCFAGEEALEGLGTGLAAIGSFDGDARPDLAIASTLRNTGVGLDGPSGTDEEGGRLYIIQGREFEMGMGARPGTGFWNLRIDLPSGNPLGFFVDATGADGAGAIVQLGSAIAGVGDVDGATGADLLVAAAGKLSPEHSAKLFQLAGRAQVGTGLEEIPAADLELIDEGTRQRFASGLNPFRNFFDAGLVDVGVSTAATDAFHVYRGDADDSFDPADRIAVEGPGGSQFSNSGFGMSTTFNASLGGAQYGDLDSDGLDDLCIGSLQSADAAGTAGPLYLFYGDQVARRTSAPPNATVRYTSAGSQVNPMARAGTSARTVQFVGDVNGDSRLDLVMGEPGANGGAGGFTVLY
jgi:FG-GAP repeat